MVGSLVRNGVVAAALLLGSTAAQASERFSLVILEAPMDASVTVVEPPRSALERVEPLDGAGRPPSVAESIEAILADDTLRNGDVVMFPSGPKVFVDPSSAPPWRAEDFVDIADSRLSRKAKRHILAVTAGTPRGLDPMPGVTATADASARTQ